MKKDMESEIYKLNPELKKYVEEYLFAEYNTSKNTILSYKYDLFGLVRFYNYQNIVNLKKEDIQEYLRVKTDASKTKAHHLTSINNFYKSL